MNKIVIWAVVAVVVLGGGYFYWQSAANKGFDTAKPYAISGEFGGSNKTAANAPTGISLKTLLSSGKAQKCSLSVGDAGAGVTGTVYVAGGKARGDFSADSAVGKVGTHLIVRDGQTYSWVDGFKTGLKAPVEVSPRTAGGGGVDINAEFGYECQSWSADNSLFTLPAEINFN